MVSKGQLNGMVGVYLTAAELSRRNLIVSPTSRSAIGADLIVTDQQCRKAWSVQVKTNGKSSNTWLLNAHVEKFVSDSHVYVLVNLLDEQHAEYFVVPSSEVARLHRSAPRKNSVWYWVDKKDMEPYAAAWSRVFGIIETANTLKIDSNDDQERNAPTEELSRPSPAQR